MSVYTKLSDTMRTSSEGNERDAFLHVEKEFAASGKPRYSWRGLEKPVLYLSNLSTLIILFIVFLQNLELRRGKATDLSNTVYCGFQRLAHMAYSWRTNPYSIHVNSSGEWCD